MADAVKDAKLRLDLDTTKAVRGMEEVVRAGEKVERQLEKTEQAAEKATGAIGSGASAAARTFERFGEGELSKSEIRGRRKNERAWERKHDAAQASVDQYRLDKHYQTIRDERQRKVSWEQMHDDAQARLDQYRLGSHYKRVRQERAEAEQQRADAEAARQSRMEAMSTARDERFTSRIGGRLSQLGLRDAPMSDYERRRAAEMNQANQSIMGEVRAIAGAIATTRSLQSGATAANAFNNADMTTTQRTQAALVATIPGFRELHEFGRAVSGVTEQIRLAQQRLANSTELIAARFANLEVMNSADARVGSAGHRRNVLRGASAVVIPGFDRTTLGGSREYEAFQSRLPGMVERDAAIREVAISQREIESARNAVSFAEGNRNFASRRRLEAQTAYNRLRNNDPGNGTLEAAQTELRRRQMFEEQANENLIRQRQRLEEVSVRGAQNEARARESVIRQMQIELEIVRQQEQRLSAASRRIGMMNPIDQRLGLEAARAIRDRGFGNVTPEIRDRAMSMFPDWMGVQAERHGEQSGVMAAARREGFENIGTDRNLQQLRAEEQRLQQQVLNETLRNQQQLAEKTVGVLYETFQNLVTLLQTRMAELERKLMLMNHMQK